MCNQCGVNGGVYVRLEDYHPSDFTVSHIDLLVLLHLGNTTVTSTITVTRQTKAAADLYLDGDELKLISTHIIIDDAPPRELKGEDAVVMTDGRLHIKASALPAEKNKTFKISTVVQFNPTTNTACSGLYKSGPMICTQCEAVGFRRIAYAIDRPDVMWTCRTRIIASHSVLPQILSNGNMTSSTIRPPSTDSERELVVYESPEEKFMTGGDVIDIVFEDPHPKPSYLFALVAGRLSNISEKFTTAEGRKVTINIWCEPEHIKKLDYAMGCVLEAMKWDEEKFGLCYDLDAFHVVAVSYFNMGAMENKGLNIFNSSCLLASRETSTDLEFDSVSACVAHEYFHNWTGNRVTCRDWFQLTLKEGLTVYRENRFTEDKTQTATSRIRDVQLMKGTQFASDAGPLAHPIRPESYEAIDNLYTVTIYSKGSEVIRMYATLLGIDGFRRGMDHYIKNFDGQAVTCDDFRESMAKANGRDLTQFKLWYNQAGTPVVTVEEEVYDANAKTYTIRLSQMTPPTPGQEVKHALHIPISVGLIGKSSKKDLIPTKVLELTETVQTFVIDGITEQPISSVLRGFSAPVRLMHERSDEDYGFIMAHDSDDVNVWEAGQCLMAKTIFSVYNSDDASTIPAESSGTTVKFITDAFLTSIKSAESSKACEAMALSLVLPAVQSMMNLLSECDPVKLAEARRTLRNRIADDCRVEFAEAYDRYTKKLNRAFDLTGESVGDRAMRNGLLSYVSVGTDGAIALKHYKDSFNELSGNMTDRLAALNVLASIPGDAATEAFMDFSKRFKDDRIIMNNWLAIQASGDHPNVLAEVQRLKASEFFDINHPTCVLLFFRSFTRNLRWFHAYDGSGYKAVADWVLEVDGVNPSRTARIVAELVNNSKLPHKQRLLLLAEVERLAGASLSKMSSEIVKKGVATLRF